MLAVLAGAEKRRFGSEKGPTPPTADIAPGYGLWPWSSEWV